jgi:hypothetical protein
MRAFLLALVMILAATAQTRAEEGVRVWPAIKSMTDADLIFSDQVMDGCLPRPKSAKNAAEVELRRSDFGINRGSLKKIIIKFVGFGVPTQSGCVASYSIEVRETIRVHENVKWANGVILAELTVYEVGGIISGPKEGFQKHVEDKSAELARNFSLVWLRLRQDAE